MLLCIRNNNNKLTNYKVYVTCAWILSVNWNLVCILNPLDSHTFDSLFSYLWLLLCCSPNSCGNSFAFKVTWLKAYTYICCQVQSLQNSGWWFLYCVLNWIVLVSICESYWLTTLHIPHAMLMLLMFMFY